LGHPTFLLGHPADFENGKNTGEEEVCNYFFKTYGLTICMAIRITNPYESYRLAIRMVHTDW